MNLNTYRDVEVRTVADISWINALRRRGLLPQDKEEVKKILVEVNDEFKGVEP